MGLYTPIILGGNSYLSWFYDRGAINDPAHTGTSKGLSQAINRGPIRKFHGLSAGARTHYVIANGFRDGLLRLLLLGLLLLLPYWQQAGLPDSRDLISGRRCTQHLTCNALSGHSLPLLLGGVPVNPRC